MISDPRTVRAHTEMWGTKKADELINFILPSRSYNTSELTNFDRIYTGWAKSQWAYVGLNSSVTECRIEISLSGMIFYHHWFEEFLKSKNIRVLFFQMKVHIRIY